MNKVKAYAMDMVVERDDLMWVRWVCISDDLVMMCDNFDADDWAPVKDETGTGYVIKPISSIDQRLYSKVVYVDLDTGNISYE